MRREASQSVDTNVTAMHAAKDALLAWLPGRLRAFTDQSVARLVAKAAHAHSNAEQTPYFDAITELKRRSTDLETEMADLVLSRLDNLGSAIRSSDPVPVPAAFELSLVDLDEFEISMSVAGMATKAENRNDQPLFEMSRRMTAIAGSVIDNTNNPLAPASVCDPFHAAMQDAPLAADALVIIYACFDDLVVAELGGRYERVKRALM